MRRQCGSLNRSIFYPSHNLSFHFPNTFSSNSLQLHFDETIQIVSHAHNSPNEPTNDTLDELSALNPAPLTTHNHLFPNNSHDSRSIFLSYTDATPTPSLLSITISDGPSPIFNDQFYHDLDDFIQHQQKSHNTDRHLTKSLRFSIRDNHIIYPHCSDSHTMHLQKVQNPTNLLNRP